MRDGGFSKSTITILYKRAGEHCTICKRITTKPHIDPEKFHNLGEAAHINGLKEGPNLRYNPNLSISELKSSKNGIWLCKTCHHIIDNDAVTYSVEHLKQIKLDHEKLISTVQELGTSLIPLIHENQERIEHYKGRIATIESSLPASDLLYNEEWNQIKATVTKLQTEKDFLENQLVKIKTQIIDLDNEELQEALLNGKNIPKALEILSDEKLKSSEINLARSRVLRARLLISQSDYNSAFQDFDRAFQFWPNYLIAIEFIQLLYFNSLNYAKIVEICEKALLEESDQYKRMKLLEHSAQARLKLHEPEIALEELLLVVEILNSSKTLSAAEQGHLATVKKHIGDCYKNMGNLQLALQNYEEALNTYFQAFLKNKEIGTVQEFAGLATAIGLLYEANNDEVEGLVHHQRALEVLNGVKGVQAAKAIILLNLASCYLKRKTFDPLAGKEHASKSVAIFTRLSRKEPNAYLEYLVGAKCLLADISIFTNQNRTEGLYLKSLKLAETLFSTNPIFISTISHVLHNYSVYLITVKRDLKNGCMVLDDAITKIKSAKLSKLEYTNYLTQALFFKVQISSSKGEQRDLLNEIIDLTQDLDSGDKSNIYKIAARQMLDNANMDM